MVQGQSHKTMVKFDLLNDKGAVRFIGNDNMTNTGEHIPAGIGYIETKAREHAKSGKAKAEDFSAFRKEYTDKATSEVKTIYIVFLASREAKPIASIR